MSWKKTSERRRCGRCCIQYLTMAYSVAVVVDDVAVVEVDSYERE